MEEWLLLRSKVGTEGQATEQWLSSNDQSFRAKFILILIAAILAKTLGFLRLQQIAMTLGVSPIADALIVASQLVWLLETVLISSAVVPALISRIYHVDQSLGAESAVNLFMHVATVCCGVILICTSIALAFPKVLGGILVPGLDERDLKIFSSLIFISALTPFFLCLAHFLSLVNRLLDNGVWYSVPQIVTNFTAILGMKIGFVLGHESGAAYGAMTGLCAGAVAVCMIQFWAIPATPRSRLCQGFKSFRSRSAYILPDLPDYWRGVASLVAVALVSEIYIFIDFYFASTLSAGYISAFGYAGRLTALVHVLFVTSVFIVLETRWSRAVSDYPNGAWNEVVGADIISLLSLLAAPVAFIFFFAPEVTAIVYGSKKLPEEERLVLNNLTMIFALGVPALALQYISVRAMIIARSYRSVFFVSLAVMPFKLILAVFLLEWSGINGLAISTISVIYLQAILNFLCLYFAIKKFLFGVKEMIQICFIYLVNFSISSVLLNYLKNVEDGVGKVMFVCVTLIFVSILANFIFGITYFGISKKQNWKN